MERSRNKSIQELESEKAILAARNKSMQITREQYLEALDIVERYHRQFREQALHQIEKTHMKTWLAAHGSQLRTQTRNALAEFEYVEDVTWDDFRRIRRAGKFGWEEFVKLRGY